MTNINYDRLFCIMCKKECIDDARQLYNLNPHIKIGSFQQSFIYNCQIGNLDMVKWLYEVKPNIDINIGFEWSCIYGNLDVSKWLYEIIPTVKISSFTFQRAFILGCEKGNLDIARWLYEIKPDININFDNEQAFVYSCKNGNLHIAKWLYEIKPDINISIRGEEAFRYSYWNGHLDIVKWLYEIKPTININSVNDFNYTTQDIIKWIISLNLNYLTYEIIDGKYKLYNKVKKDNNIVFYNKCWCMFKIRNLFNRIFNV